MWIQNPWAYPYRALLGPFIKFNVAYNQLWTVPLPKYGKPGIHGKHWRFMTLAPTPMNFMNGPLGLFNHNDIVHRKWPLLTGDGGGGSRWNWKRPTVTFKTLMLKPWSWTNEMHEQVPNKKCTFKSDSAGLIIYLNGTLKKWCQMVAKGYWNLENHCFLFT